MPSPLCHDKIVEKYNERDKDCERYSLFQPGNLYLLQPRERVLLKLLQQQGYYPLTSRWVLDIGCGFGGELRRWLGYGLSPNQAIGVDINPDRLRKAQRLGPNILFVFADGKSLPFASESFDIVLLFTVLSSVLDPSHRLNIAKEAWRVLKDNGAVVWYDFIWNPINKSVTGISLTELKRLFPEAVFVLRRVSLAPPLARRIAPISFLLAACLDVIPFLHTHYLGLLIKK